MQLEGMDGSFRQADVLLHFVLGVLSWSASLARTVAELEPVAGSEAAPAEPALSGAALSGPALSGPELAALHLLLGLISFDQTLRAALEPAAAAVVREPEHAVDRFELRLGR